jgi:mRNA interferase RelE/StbE
MKRVVILPVAAKSLRRYRSEAKRLMEKIQAYARDPSSQANNVKALHGTSGSRLRVGGFRVIFEETPDEIVVTKIGPRGGVYD